jgi:FSR family fosmidomycin resistance protein-like MFS transporter
MANSPFRAIFGNRSLMTLAAGHFTVDMYAGLLPVLYPILTDRFDLSLATVGFVALAYSGASSISQPFFGWLADRYGTRFTGFALAWSAVLFSTIGFAEDFALLLLLATLAGLGSGAFHPFGAISASSVIGNKNRNTAMSVYATGGTLGVAIGPMIGAVLFHVFGMRGTAVMILPGVSIALWLLFAMRTSSVSGTRSKGYVPPAVKHAIPYGAVGMIIAVMMLRMFPTIGLQNFIPLWYDDLGYGASFYGPLATTILLASAVGALGAGSLADTYGRRAVMLVTTALSIPAVWAFAEFPGPLAFVFGSLIGLLSGSTAPLLLVMAQQLMVGRAGVASGFILGLGFVAGAIGTPIFGAIGDAFGMQNAVRSQIIVLLLACLAAWNLPTEARMREIQDAQDAAQPREAAPARS